MPLFWKSECAGFRSILTFQRDSRLALLMGCGAVSRPSKEGTASEKGLWVVHARTGLWPRQTSGKTRYSSLAWTRGDFHRVVWVLWLVRSLKKPFIGNHTGELLVLQGILWQAHNSMHDVVRVRRDFNLPNVSKRRIWRDQVAFGWRVLKVEK